MNDLIPEMLDEKDMNSAWKNKPFKVIGLLLLFLIDFAAAIIPAGYFQEIFEKIKVSDNLKWLMNVIQHISFFIIFIICFAVLIILEYIIIGLIVFIIKKLRKK